jgi:hypothetical protein
MLNAMDKIKDTSTVFGYNLMTTSALIALFKAMGKRILYNHPKEPNCKQSIIEELRKRNVFGYK